MEQQQNTYPTSAQRVIATHLRELAEFQPAEGVDSGAQSNLSAFFREMYTQMYARPESFGLPLNPDDAILPGEPNLKERKQEIKRLLDKTRNQVNRGLDFLMRAGQRGVPEANVLRIDSYPDLLRESKVSKPFLSGLASAGLQIRAEGAGARLWNERFPAMMAALTELAKACAHFDPPQAGRFQFARCDLGAIAGQEPAPTDLFRAFEGEEQERVNRLHDYFTRRGYQTILAVNTQGDWTVQYQGDRKVKASPLFQVEYQERYRNPLRLQIKCASTARIAPFLPDQPQGLQEDFQKRVFICRGDECGWCRNQKTLGPTDLVFRGETRTVCWFSNSEIDEVNESAVELIEQYERMHALLKN